MAFILLCDFSVSFLCFLSLPPSAFFFFARFLTPIPTRLYSGRIILFLSHPGGAGSGGSHIKVTVIGGKAGVTLGEAQPSPAVSGLTLINQSVSAVVYETPGRQVHVVFGTCS